MALMSGAKQSTALRCDRLLPPITRLIHINRQGGAVNKFNKNYRKFVKIGICCPSYPRCHI